MQTRDCPGPATPSDAARERAIAEIAAACAREARFWRVQVRLGAFLILLIVFGELLYIWLPHRIVFVVRTAALASYAAIYASIGSLSRLSRR